MATAPTTELSVTGYPKGGRPAKIGDPFRWHLVVNRRHRDQGAERARREGHGDLTDVLRALMADYAAGRVTPSEQAAAEVAAPTPIEATP